MEAMDYYDCLADENKSIHTGDVNVSMSEGWE